MPDAFLKHVKGVLGRIEADHLGRHERPLAGPQGGRVSLCAGYGTGQAVNLCANNYLGLANHPDIIEAAKTALDEWGFGMASVRFICGTQTLHRELEQRIARYLGKDDAILFGSCFDANGGIFEALLGPEDAVVSDALNHASIIDGIRLSKAARYRFANGDMNELEDRLGEADKAGARFRLIVTDGVFSMDGHMANLPEVCDLAQRFDALVMVDDCHATGHIGAGGRGTPAATGVGQRIDIISGTLGKSLGGASGGFVAAAQPIVDLLRQHARPYLFSNSLPPAIAAGSKAAIDIAARADDRRDLLQAHTKRFRTGLAEAGFDLLPGGTPIVPVMLHDAGRSQAMAEALGHRGVYVASFSFPVVPKGKARIRTQMSAALTVSDVDFAIDAFRDAGKSLGVV